MSILPYFCLSIKTKAVFKGDIMFSKVIISLILMSFMSTTIACNDKKVMIGPKAEYHSASQELLHKISKLESRESISDAAKKVSDLATPLLKDLVAKKPKCAEIASFIQKKKLEMYDLKPVQLEADYHEGAVLPTFPDECHDLKELIVHPATVVSLVKYTSDISKVKERMRDEIEEVMMHFEAL